MSENSTYLVLKEQGTSIIKSRGSKFFGYCYPVNNETEAKEILNSLKSEFPDATHHCFAWIMGPNMQHQRAYDDGEPANSAGKPILRELLRKNLTNTLVVVVRYYGGTNLGVPGLIENYGLAAAEALNNGKTVEKYEETLFELNCSFANEQLVYRLQKQFGFVIQSRKTDDNVHFEIWVSKSKADAFALACKDIQGFVLNMKSN